MRQTFALFIALAAAASIASPAAAATRHHARHRLYYVEYYPPGATVHRRAPVRRYTAEVPRGRELVIQKRSYLDAGVVVPVGSESAYVAQSTIDAPYVVRDLLHQRYDGWRANKFSIPGNPAPLVEFETPPVP